MIDLAGGQKSYRFCGEVKPVEELTRKKERDSKNKEKIKENQVQYRAKKELKKGENREVQKRVEIQTQSYKF